MPRADYLAEIVYLTLAQGLALMGARVLHGKKLSLMHRKAYSEFVHDNQPRFMFLDLTSCVNFTFK